MNTKIWMPVGLVALVLASVMTPAVSMAKGKTVANHVKTARTTAATQTKTRTQTLAMQATSLQKMITNQINVLTRRQTNLTTRIAAKKTSGFDVSGTDAGMSDLATQIGNLKGITVNMNPSTSGDLVTARNNYQAARKAALTDIRNVNVVLAKAKKV